jgi:hypothetical protein
MIYLSIELDELVATTRPWTAWPFSIPATHGSRSGKSDARKARSR